MAMIRRVLKKGQGWERKGPIPSLGPLLYPPNQGLLRRVPCGDKQENR
jgi:hypothetical protein